MIELRIEDLVELVKNAPREMTTLDILNLWRHKYETAKDELQKKAVQHSIDNPMKYGIKRIEESMQESAGAYFPVYKAVEHFSVAQNDLPAFAGHIGARADDLYALVQGKRHDVITKKGIYRGCDSPSWSATIEWRDRTQELTDRAELLQEDKRTESMVGAINASRLLSGKPEAAAPTYTEWKKK